MNSKTYVLTLGVVAAAVLMLPDLASARDLGAAATSAVATAKTVARILSIFGIIVGGVLMQIPGLNEFGKRTVGAGCIGCLCAFGGPALISFFEGVFGAA